MGDTVVYNTTTFSVDRLDSTTTNHAGGFACMLGLRDQAIKFSAVFGTPTGAAPSIMIVSHPDGYYRQAGYETKFGMSNAGRLGLSALLGRKTCETSDEPPGTGLMDSLWVDKTRLLAEGEQAITDEYRWRFLSRVGMTADARPYWFGGVTPNGEMHATHRGLFLGDDATPMLLTGMTPTGLPAPLSDANTVGCFGLSSMTGHLLAAVNMKPASGPPLPKGSEWAAVLDGHGLNLGGQLVRGGSNIGASGALPGEKWKRFIAAAVTEGAPQPRNWCMAATTSAALSSNEVVVKNGAIVFRKGSPLDGHTPTGPITNLAMNESGDLLIVCKVDGTSPTAPGVDAVYFNGTVVLLQGATVAVRPAQTGILTTILGLNTSTLSDRASTGGVTAYLVANVEILAPNATEPSPQSDDRLAVFYSLALQTTGAVSCAADFNLDGALTIDDVLSYMNAWMSQDPRADVNHDGLLNAQDMFDFLNAWFAGCA